MKTTAVSSLSTAVTTASINSSVSFTMKAGTAIYGGFAGTETSVTQRNPTNNPTYLKPANAKYSCAYLPE